MPPEEAEITIRVMAERLEKLESELKVLSEENTFLKQRLDEERNKQLPNTIYSSRNKRPRTSPTTPIQNRFNALQCDDDVSDGHPEIDDVEDAPMTNEQFSQLIRSSNQVPTQDPSPSPPPKTTQTPDTNKRIPPIVLRENARWTDLTKRMDTHKIQFSNAKNTAEGIKIFTNSTDDYRKLTKLMEDEKYPFHTFTLDEEKHLKVVIRGMPVDLAISEIEENLKQKGFNPIKLIRMTKGPQKISIPLVLIILAREERRIYDETTICGLSIKIEALRNSASLGQCFRCQQFGHSQARCTAPWVCVKCGSSHPSFECPKARQEPATCANCKGPHPASYRGCPSYPKPQIHATQKLNPWTNNRNSNEQITFSKSDFPQLPTKGIKSTSASDIDTLKALFLSLLDKIFENSNNVSLNSQNN